ncbi:hypothetical protein L7F22_067238 [Adiantum nelumboides]|nr:hypothetical protein [Adiantum nelumboides]
MKEKSKLEGPSKRQQVANPLEPLTIAKATTISLPSITFQKASWPGLGIVAQRLYFLYSKNLERALRILDQKGVYRITGEPSKRVVFQVAGESKSSEKYLCLPKHFCSCQSFFFDVVGRGEQLCCKHQLASRIADALGICQQAAVPDEELALLLLQ